MKARGFTITEILIAVAVMAILAGALAPLAVKQITRAQRARALREVSTLAESVHTFRRDVKAFPDRSGGAQGAVGYLLTAGTAPTGLASWQGPSGLAADHLVNNSPSGSNYPTTGVAAWNGPYLPNNPTDPWGNAYAISVAGMRGDGSLRGWVLSAGPNGVLETDDGSAQIAASSDDLGWRLR